MTMQGIGSREVHLVYCLSIDLIESTMPGLRMTQAELDRFNRALVAQIEPHLEALAFEDLLVKFTGDGWLLMSPQLRDAERLCGLSAIMRTRFSADMQQRTGLPVTRIPSLRMAICTGRDIRVQAWQGAFDWVGDSARRATRSAALCFPNEVLIDGAVQSLVMRDFVTQRVDPAVRPGARRPSRREEDIPLWTLGDLRMEAAEDWHAPAAFVYTLAQLGRTDDATEASMRAATRLGEEDVADLGLADGARTIGRWNRLISNAPTYDAVLEVLARLMESQAIANVDTLNALIDRSPTFEEALRWVADLEHRGVHPDTVSYNTLIRRAPDYESAVEFLQVMDAANTTPNRSTLLILVTRAPTFRVALGLLSSLADRGVTPDVEVFGRLVARAPGYDAGVALLDVMSTWSVLPSAEVMNRLIARAPDYDTAAGWLEDMAKKGIEPDIQTFNALIARAPRYGAALGWLEVIREHGIEADVTTFNTLMARAPGHDVAVSLLREMERGEVTPNSETFKTLIARGPDYATAAGWLAEMSRRGIRPNNEVFKALITQSPDYPTARSWLDEMPSHEVAANTETFRTLMGRAPDYATARDLLDAMLQRGIQPTGETFKTMAALATDPAQAKELVKLMPEVGVRPSASSFTPLIAHAADFRAAREWLGHMRETGVSPNSETLTALMKRAGSHQEAAAVLKDLQDEVEPNEGAYRILVDVAPDFASARRWVDQMRQEGMRPSGAVLTELLSKPPSEMSGNELLAWYLALDHHPSAPMQAAIEAYRAAGQIRDALRLALDYPHIEAARTLFGLHREEALDYLTDVVATDPGHANGHYALGLALLELGRTEEALRALDLARELARPGPRVAALEEIIRHARDSSSSPGEG